MVERRLDEKVFLVLKKSDKGRYRMDTTAAKRVARAQLKNRCLEAVDVDEVM